MPRLRDRVRLSTSALRDSDVVRRYRLVPLGAAGVCASVALWLIDPETAPFGWRCPLWTLTGLRCPGCGGTRALHLLVRGKPIAAARQNVIVVVLAPVYGVLIARWLKAYRDGTPKPLMTPSESRIATCVLTSFGVTRNVLAVALRRKACPHPGSLQSGLVGATRVRVRRSARPPRSGRARSCQLHAKT